jgi:hypothetical protein
MKLSANTIKILQNFATINPNIVVNENEGVLKTVSEAKNIMARASIEDNIGASFGIYDLNEFLSAVNLLESPEFTFNNNLIEVKDEKAKRGLKYFCANPEILTYPKKDIQNPTYDVEFVLTQEYINAIKKAASVLGFDTFSLVKEADSSEIMAQVFDPENKSSNAYKIVVGSIDQASSFSFDFLIANLKMIPGDYTVSLSSRLISRWVTNFDPSITYWIALEKTSNYTK